MTKTITDLDDFKALDPFFRIIEKGLKGIADASSTCWPKTLSSTTSSRFPATQGASKAARPSPSSTALTEIGALTPARAYLAAFLAGVFLAAVLSVMGHCVTPAVTAAHRAL